MTLGVPSSTELSPSGAGAGRRRWQTRGVRISHFWQLMDDEFGEAYSRTLARDHVLHRLGNRTAMAALEDGEAPREVWHALCADLDVPEERWLGRDVRVAPGAPGAVR